MKRFSGLIHAALLCLMQPQRMQDPTASKTLPWWCRSLRGGPILSPGGWADALSANQADRHRREQGRRRAVAWAWRMRARPVPTATPSDGALDRFHHSGGGQDSSGRARYLLTS